MTFDSYRFPSNPSTYILLCARTLPHKRIGVKCPQLMNKRIYSSPEQLVNYNNIECTEVRKLERYSISVGQFA